MSATAQPIVVTPPAARTTSRRMRALRVAPVRLPSLDAFRGLTVAAMLLVNNPGSRTDVYAPLRHAAWNGWTPTDLVFPFFLFIVGVTTHLSLSARTARGDDASAVRRQVLRRGATIFALGLLLNWIPFYQSGAIAGHAHPSFGDRLLERLLDLRAMGVLQRIGLAYVAAAALTWRASARRVAATVIVLLVGYWMAMTLLPVPGELGTGAALLGAPGHTMAAWADRVTLDWTRWGLGNHLRDGGAFDPEGVLSTLPAIATTMLGVLAGRWLGTHAPVAGRLRALSAAGLAALAIGAAWGLAFPINKNLWTSSYVLFTAGAAALVLCAVAWLMDVRGWRTWARPLVVYGSNPMVAFIGSEVLATVLHSTIKVKVDGHRIAATEWIYRAFATGLPPRAASLAYALAFVLVWYAVLLELHRRKIYFKV